jgi:hypothetical protein
VSYQEHKSHLHALNKLSNLKMLTVPFYSLRADNLKNMELRAESLDINTTIPLQQRIRHLEGMANSEWEKIGNQTLSLSAAEFEFDRMPVTPDAKGNFVETGTNKYQQPRTGGLSSSLSSAKLHENAAAADDKKALAMSKSVDSFPRIADGNKLEPIKPKLKSKNIMRVVCVLWV